MRKSKSDKKIWVKRIWVAKEEYDYLFMPTSQFNSVLSSRANDLRSTPEHMRLEKASWWYSFYRTNKPDLSKGTEYTVAAIAGAIISELIHSLFS